MKDRILEFYNSDFEGTLFPMETCRVVIENAFDELVAYIKKVATDSEPNFDISDREASLVLESIKLYTDELHVYMPIFLHQHPNLIKKVYAFCDHCEDKSALTQEFIELVRQNDYLNEYQLFWVAKIAEAYLLQTKDVGVLLSLLYEHKDSTVISKAKILEIPEHRFGLPELRETHLKNGSSGWLAWASAVGSRKDPKQAKNYLMDYVSKVSPINKLIGECVKRL